MEDQEIVTNLSPEHRLKPALLLDFDGTIRKSKTGEFIQNSRDIELIPGIEKIIWLYRDMGFLILGVSNQGGVAHGFKLPMEIENEMDATLKLFQQPHPFHGVKFCFSDAKGKIEPYCHRSLNRKPNYGMLAVMEIEAYNQGVIIDWDNSIFVGDRPEDEECAKSAGVKFIHINTFLTMPHAFQIG